MIKSLNILNFQGHRESSLSFHEGVNVITGTSDSGKTTILRALSWLETNRPSGDAFKNWDAPLKDPVSVAIELDDGTSIILERQNNRNTYSIYNAEGEPITFSAIKTDVPKEVTDLLNLCEYNSQGQHQSYFLLQNTPGEVAKRLNDLVGLSIIDTLFSNLAGKIRELNSSISNISIQHDRATEELDQYRNLDAVKIIIESLEKLHEETAVIESSLDNIKTKLSTLEKIKTSKEELIPFLELEPEVEGILTSIDFFSDIEAKASKLDQLVVSLKKIQAQIPKEEKWLEVEPRYNDLNGLIATNIELRGRIDLLEKLLTTLSNIRNSINTQKQSLLDYIDQYIKLIKESKICPTCNSAIDEDCLAAIERSFQ